MTDHDPPLVLRLTCRIESTLTRLIDALTAADDEQDDAPDAERN